MDFEADLVNIIKQQFDRAALRYKNDGDAGYFASRYYEMLNRRIVPTPRRVHFSDELNDTLGKLAQETSAEQREKALEAWRTVFFIRHLLVEGQNVTRFLSERVDDPEFSDGLLWDFGMHHFHLSRKLKKPESKFVERSDYLLFAIITQEDAFFVDVRPHRDPEQLGWVRQDLLSIVHSNWPKLIESKMLRGVKGTVLTDQEKRELRRKNTNHAAQLGDNAIAPIGGGTMADGSSLLCQWWGLKLLHEIKQHQCYFDSQPVELRSRLEAMGMEIADRMEFELVLLDSLNPSAEVVSSLREKRCLSRDLCRIGFVVVEAPTRLPIVVSLEDQP